MKRFFIFVLIFSLILTGTSIITVKKAVAGTTDTPSSGKTLPSGTEVTATFSGTISFTAYTNDYRQESVIKNAGVCTLKTGTSYKIIVEDYGIYQPNLAGSSGILPGAEEGTFTVTGESPKICVGRQMRSGDIWFYNSSFIIGEYASDEDFLAHYSECKLQDASLAENGIYGNFSVRNMHIICPDGAKILLKNNLTVNQIQINGGNCRFEGSDYKLTSTNGIYNKDGLAELYFDIEVETTQITGCRYLSLHHDTNRISGAINCNSLSISGTTENSGSTVTGDVTAASGITVSNAVWNCSDIQCTSFTANSSNVTSTGNVTTESAYLNSETNLTCKNITSTSFTATASQMTADSLTASLEFVLSEQAKGTISGTVDVMDIRESSDSDITAGTLIIRGVGSELTQGSFQKIQTTSDGGTIANILADGKGLFYKDTGKNVQNLFTDSIEYEAGIQLKEAPFYLKYSMPRTSQIFSGEVISVQADIPSGTTNDLTYTWYQVDTVTGARQKISGETSIDTGSEHGTVDVPVNELYIRDGWDTGLYYLTCTITNSDNSYSLDSPACILAVVPRYITGIDAHDISASSMTIQWDACTGVNGYILTVDPIDTPAYTIEVPAGQTQYTLENLFSEHMYGIGVKGYIDYYGKKFQGEEIHLGFDTLAEGEDPDTTETPPEVTVSEAPLETPSPDITAAPDISDSPEPTAAPDVSPTQKPTEAPHTDIPSPTQSPVITPDTQVSTKQYTKGAKITDTKTKAIYKVTKSDSQNSSVSYVKPPKAVKSVSIPNTVEIDGMQYKVTSIDTKAFRGQKKLKKVTIPSNISKIGSQAFYGCKKLKTIVIKSAKLSVKNIGKNAFKGIPKKATVKLPKKKYTSYKKLLKKKGLNGRFQPM